MINISLFLFLTLMATFAFHSASVWRRNVLGFPLVASFGLMVAWYTIGFNLLSLAHSVTQVGTVIWTALPPVYVGAKLLKSRVRRRIRLSLQLRQALWIVSPLAMGSLFVALMLPPNNYDGMTYHMAKVAHWLLNRSVDYFPTFYSPQNQMGPGAEYLILALQAMAQDDRWAGCVQWLAYVCSLFGTWSLCKELAIPGRLACWIVVLVGTTPMIVLESSTVQNDLVTSAIMLSLVLGALAIYKNQSLTIAQAFQFGCFLGAGFLVKPTSLLVAMPILLFVAVASVCRSFKERRSPPLLGAALYAIAVSLLLVAPDINRKFHATGSAFGARDEVYPILSDWSDDRVANLAMIWQLHSPDPHATRDKFNISVFAIDKRFGLNMRGFDEVRYFNALTTSEDRAGNPIQAMIIIGAGIPGALLGLVFAAWRRRVQILTRTLMMSVPFLSASCLALMVRLQPWMSRLHTPVFYLLPFCFVGIAAFPRCKLASRISLAGAKALGVFACLYASVALVNGKPVLTAAHLMGHDRPNREASYYLGRPAQKAADDEALAAASREDCRQIGLDLTPGDFDYPLTWRAYRRGITARHVDPDHTGQACLLYSPASGSASIVRLPVAR